MSPRMERVPREGGPDSDRPLLSGHPGREYLRRVSGVLVL